MSHLTLYQLLMHAVGYCGGTIWPPCKWTCSVFKYRCLFSVKESTNVIFGDFISLKTSFFIPFHVSRWAFLSLLNPTRQALFFSWCNQFRLFLRTVKIAKPHWWNTSESYICIWDITQSWEGENVSKCFPALSGLLHRLQRQNQPGRGLSQSGHCPINNPNRTQP